VCALRSVYTNSYFRVASHLVLDKNWITPVFALVADATKVGRRGKSMLV
jgi:hypothetical protein